MRPPSNACASAPSSRWMLRRIWWSCLLRASGSLNRGRASELRALGERKAAAFRQSQMGRQLRVLTLHPCGDDSNDRTPALSSNYLRLLVRGVFPANQWLYVEPSGCEGTFLTGQVSD